MYFFLCAVCLLSHDVWVTSAGERSKGTIVAFTDRTVQVRPSSVDGSNTDNLSEIPFEGLASIEFESQPVVPSESFALVRLIDGSTIRATLFSMQKDDAVLQLGSDGSLAIPRRNLDNVFFKGRANDGTPAEWKNLVSDRSIGGDALVLTRNGRMDMLEGIVGEISPERVAFKMDERSANIKRSKLEGIVFYQLAGREFTKPICELRLIDGSLLKVKSLGIGDDGLRMTTVSGADLQIEKRMIAKLDFAVGRAKYLGSMTPSSRDWTPLIASSSILSRLKQLKLPRANESFDSRRLSLRVSSEDGGFSEIREFETGYAMPGGSKLAFALDSQFERLTGQVGFAPFASDEGEVFLQIRTDSGIAFSQRLKNETLDNPVDLDLSVKGCDRLVIEVNYHDGRAVGDLLHLCDLKVSR